MDMTELGLIDPWGDVEKPVRSDYSGALISVDTEISLPEEGADEFEKQMRRLLDKAAARRNSKTRDGDPVVSIPCYGRFAAPGLGLQSVGWMPQLNLMPHRRAAAGLGSAIVRQHQERFMAAAWDQVGQIRETNRLLNRAVLRREASQSWKARAMQLDPEQTLGVLKSQLTFLRDARNRPLRQRLSSSTVPNGVIGAAMARMLRPSFVIQKSFTAPLRRALETGEEQNYQNRQNWRGMFVNRIDTVDQRDALALGRPKMPAGMRTSDPRRGPLPGTVPPAQVPDPVSLTDMKSTVRQTLRPEVVVRKQMELRVPALATVLQDESSDVIPTRVTAGPVLDEALSTTLMAMSPTLLMPGVDEFPENAIHLVEADAGFVAALLAGANHEMARELLWREYPAAMNHTCFARFWARPDSGVKDIKPMDMWQENLPLEQLGQAGGESVVVLVRGDLLRQFPSTRFLLLEPGMDTPRGPSFTGRLPPDVAFFGFDVSPADVVTAPDSEWAVVIEEPAFEPRFGLDLASDGTPLMSYSELSWDHLTQQTGDHLRIAPEETIAQNPGLQDEATWGLNGAHMAFATHQQPFRRYFRAVDILGAGV